ncbi:alpha-2,8-sialyltransferase 8F isoform X4 [Arapaima gigas]
MIVRRRKAVVWFLSATGVAVLLFWCGRLRRSWDPSPSPQGPEPTPPGTTVPYRADVNLKLYRRTWKKQESSYSSFRHNLSSKCHGTSQAFITQTNTPLGTKVVYDGEKKHSEKVTSAIFATFAKEQPFENVTWETCSVVGNGGILVNSSCGEEIDSAQLVIRCNLPPVGNQYTRDVGSKTNMVTANPSILLNNRRRPFVEYVGGYGSSLLLLPAFSYTQNLQVCLRAVYTLEETSSRIQPVFINPAYLQGLNEFWKDHGLQVLRISTGLMMASLALERCAQVNLYGFWPYVSHPYSDRPLTNHYYDNQPFKPHTHDVPAEFKQLLQLHNQGVLRLHLDRCGPDRRRHKGPT